MEREVRTATPERPVQGQAMLQVIMIEIGTEVHGAEDISQCLLRRSTAPIGHYEASCSNQHSALKKARDIPPLASRETGQQFIPFFEDFVKTLSAQKPSRV